MSTSSVVRDARRRRILERGPDRLALITGRIENLPPSTKSESSPPSDLSSYRSDQPTSDFSQTQSETSSLLLLKHDSGATFRQHGTCDTGSMAGPIVSNHGGMGVETFAAPSLEQYKHEPLLDTPTVDDSSLSTSTREHHSESQMHTRLHKLFASEKISSAVAASEIARTSFSVAVAFLVVLSYFGFPNLIKGLVVFRPLYLVLLTNASIVLAQLLVESQVGIETAEQQTANVSSTSNDGLAEQLGKALESGLAIQNIMAALFMDCSVYAIVLICGIGLAQRLGG